jgi:hypothetical protein
MSSENEMTLALAEDELLPCGILIDKEGDWYHGGSLMHRTDVVAHLCRHISRDELSGLYIVQIGKQRCYLEVEDCPLVVTRVQHEKDEDGQERFVLSIKHIEATEHLDPATLCVGEENVLYCKVAEDKIPARFLRPAYYQLAEFIHEDLEQKRFYLSVGNEHYYIEKLPI